MRLSTRPGDPGYCAEAFSYDVYLDGEKISRCFTADEERGEVFCYDTDDQGHVIVDKENGCIKEIKLTGTVKLVRCEE